VFAPVIGPHPRGAAPGNAAGNRRRCLGGHDAGLPHIASVPERARLLSQIRVGPIIDPARIGQHDFAVFVFAGQPESVFRRQLHAVRVERIDQRVPEVARDVVFVEPEQLVKIVAHPQQDAFSPRRPICREHEARQQARRTMLDRQRVR